MASGIEHFSALSACSAALSFRPEVCQGQAGVEKSGLRASEMLGRKPDVSTALDMTDVRKLPALCHSHSIVAGGLLETS